MKTLSYVNAILLLSSIGCTSFQSTIMSRLPNDRLQRNSNQCVKGIPVTVKIPTHVDVVVTEEYFITQGDPTQGTVTGKVETRISNLSKPLRSVSMQTVYTPKVLTTNFVRPAAGTLNVGSKTADGITMDPDNYFAAIQADIDDQTLEDINAAIPNIKKVLGLPADKAKGVAAGGEETVLNKCESFKSVIAYRRFDINEIGWEQEVQAFVDAHIACQIQPCTSPGVECYGQKNENPPVIVSTNIPN